ncbi:HAD-IIB family hydrolase [Bremerella alba]|uniref:sucrose-phosphate synthase n=1 Tax=Bremerella alba TaxID=980252 RepID=A0A7V8V2T2_9BACT|nr:HAD-IIB family hydrolase [Bremerella alba]MBA2113894.1 D-inositol-3-phosphate glycosyltransferase [Bremerella alba]
MKIALISLHGLIRAKDAELGRDADTGGQVKYVLELAAELAKEPEVTEVELLTRQIIDDRVSDDYAQVEEPICENAKIVRIPFGPKRYIRKESLWPYIEFFVDQTLAHFRRAGLPDLIHGHYADAGLAGAQLARLLHIPFVFTGHSLGRVKQERLIAKGKSVEDLERRYRLAQRIEAEEVALETASMVVASTNQEVELQYEKYENYVPDRMEVIPPGVNLQSFAPPKSTDDDYAIGPQIERFLRDPSKPPLIAMARPDERKNLEMLVRVYGESERLQELSNLVLIMGTRENLKDLAPAQRRIVEQILGKIDDFDLYGSVAYPKMHAPSDVPDIYRWCAQRRGVFVNPALTEPFGLTLLEAAAAGLPIVATNDGGPRDIVANCHNGLLVDPLDPEAIEKALLRMLTEPEQWDDWANQGKDGAKKHYSWANHAKRYWRDINDILDHSAKPDLARNSKVRRMPNFDRLIITDLDNTLTGDDDALRELMDTIREHDYIGFGISTGRRLDSAMEQIEEMNLPRPDLICAAVGTELYYGEYLTNDRTWRKQIGLHWTPDKIRALFEGVDGVYVQKDFQQSEFKISFDLDKSVAPSISEIKRMLREAGIRARVVFSRDMYLDILPNRGGPGVAVRHVLYKWGFSPEKVLVAGDSGNDEGMLKGRTLGVVVGNYSPELEKLRDWPRIYFSEGHHARGILEGINYYQFLDNITIPNDRNE